MKNEKYYSTGKASKICGVSARMLRYYEEIGLIIPDRIDEKSGYRYYLPETLLAIQGVRYMADSGFSLEEIGKFWHEDPDYMKKTFIESIDKTKEKINYQIHRLESLKDWLSLFIEGDNVRQHIGSFDADIKYFPEQRYFSFTREHPVDEEKADITTEIQYMTASKQDGRSMVDVGGAMIFVYGNYEDRMNGNITRETICQTIYSNSANLENTRVCSGFLGVSSYHTGSLENVSETYTKMIEWAENHNFHLRGDSMERRVIDHFSTKDPSDYVTNIILPVKEDSSYMQLMYEYSNKRP